MHDDDEHFRVLFDPRERFVPRDLSATGVAVAHSAALSADVIRALCVDSEVLVQVG